MPLGQAFVGAGGGGGGTLIVKDEGSTLTSAATSLDVVGAGAAATNVGGAVTLTIPGSTGRFWDVSAIPTDAAVQTARTLDFANGATSLTGFTWGNQGSATAAIQRKRLVVAAPATAGYSLRVHYPDSTHQLPTSGSWCVQAPTTLIGVTNFSKAGILVKGATLGRIMTIAWLMRNDTGIVYVTWVGRSTSETALTSDQNQPGFPQGVLAIGFDGTNISLYSSPDGRDWPPSANLVEAVASYIGAGPYTYGFFADSQSAKPASAAFNNAVVLNQATPVPHGQFV